MPVKNLEAKNDFRSIYDRDIQTKVEIGNFQFDISPARNRLRIRD